MKPNIAKEFVHYAHDWESCSGDMAGAGEEQEEARTAAVAGAGEEQERAGQGTAQHSGGHASGRAGERGRGGGTVEELARAPMRRGHDEECGGTGGADDAREPAGGYASKDRGTGRCRAGTRRYNAELSTRAVKDLE